MNTEHLKFLSMYIHGCDSLVTVQQCLYTERHSIIYTVTLMIILSCSSFLQPYHQTRNYNKVKRFLVYYCKTNNKIVYQ